MATTPLTPIVSGVDLTTAWQTIYTVSTADDRVGIDAVVFNNYSASTSSFSVRLVQAGTPTVLNEVITDKDIRNGRNDLAPAMIGQSVKKGGLIQAKASANNSINANITATVISI
jgi:hypothetical protein